MSSPPRSVPVFTWEGDLEIDDEDEEDGQRLTAGLARLPTEAFRKGLEANHISVRDVFRDNGLGGYFLWAVNGKDVYEFFLHWTGMGSPDEDYFAIQGGLSRGCLVSLFWRGATVEELAEMASLLEAALGDISSIRNLQWLTEEEINACYGGGTPLPERAEES